MTEPSTVQRIGTEDADERRTALLARVDESIGRPGSGPSEAAQAIAIALGDEDWRVRKEAVGLVRSVPSDRIIPYLVAGIVQSDNVGLRNSAIEGAGYLGDAIVPELERAFDEGEGASRRFIVSALGMTRSLAASDVLVRASVDPDENLVVASIDALARIGGPKAEVTIRKRLRESASYERMAALDALDRLEVSVPFEDLAGVLTDPVLRRAALGVLGRSRSEQAVPILFEALTERPLGVQATVVVALEHLAESSDEAAIRVAAEARTLSAPSRQVVKKLLGSGEPNVRRAAANLLLLAHDADSLGEILTIAAELSLSSASLAALAGWGERAIEPLLDLAEIGVGAVPALALEIAADLACQGAESVALPRLRDAVRKALGGRDELLREAAVRSLSACATLEDVGALVELATSSRIEDSLRAGAALERLAGEDAARVEAALAVVDPAAGGGALCPVLARLGSQGAVDRIAACLSADDPRARRAAVVALADTRGASSLESLALALADEDVDVRATAAMMLGRIRDDEGRPVGAERLQHAIDHESPVVQTAAVLALVDIGETRARDRIAKLVHSTHPEVAATAIGALRSFGFDRVTELALDAAKSGAEEVVVATLRVLADREVPESAHEFVRVSLGHASWEARLAAVEVAATLREGRGWLGDAYSAESEPMVRRAIETALELELP